MSPAEQLRSQIKGTSIACKAARLLMTTAELGSKPCWYAETALMFSVKLFLVIPTQIAITVLLSPIAFVINWRRKDVNADEQRTAAERQQ